MKYKVKDVVTINKEFYEYDGFEGIIKEVYPKDNEYKVRVRINDEEVVNLYFEENELE